jgi:hypothetical protein
MGSPEIGKARAPSGVPAISKKRAIPGRKEICEAWSPPRASRVWASLTPRTQRIAARIQGPRCGKTVIAATTTGRTTTAVAIRRKRFEEKTLMPAKWTR